MFEQKPLSENLNQKFNDLNAENFTIFGINIGGKKKKKENEYDYNEVEAAAMLNKRRQANAGIIEQNLLNDPNRIENRIKNKVIKPPVRGYKRPKFDLDGAIGAIGDLLTGNSGKQPDLTLNEGAELGLDRTGQSTLPVYVASSKKKNNNTVFYIIIAVLVVIGTFLLIKKNK